MRVDVWLDAADRRSALDDATFWSLRAQPRELPAVWLYDERGSRLFDEITRLPEYYLTRSERKILTQHVAEIAGRTGARTLVELGSGTSDKTRLLLNALAGEGTLERFVPVDVSEDILVASARAVADEYPTLGVHAIVGDFERHLHGIPSGGGRLVAFLGSTIGNLDPARRARLFGTIAALLAPDDAFLLGIDLVKDPARLEAAYNDSRGVTERFVRNGLDVVNRELDAEFHQERFAFVARWDEGNEWMDIGFHARDAHDVAIRKLETVASFAAGEQLRFEISAKFRRDAVVAELEAAGMSVDEWWTDRSADFALVLATRSPDEP